tara:strand:- start:30 stop:1478 length:1449 start_codon:yes stop_codon:yes gene_type:complete
MSLFDKINLPPSEYKVHTFTSTGTSTFAVTGSGDVEYLVIAGGAGGGGTSTGGGYATGGGGAGGYRTATGYGVTAQSYSITVGTGGAGGGGNSQGSSGSNSIFDTITSTGGGGGGSRVEGSSQDGVAGGSGGGGGTDNYGSGHVTTGGTSTAYGNNGGTGQHIAGASAGGGGGGGSSASGSNNSGNTGGSGGAGTSSSITGTAVIRAGGGGGNGGTVSGAGGSGGGGAGIGGNSNGISGTINTGSGGGGGGATIGNLGGAGGSGIVIIRYLTSSDITATGGTITNVSVPVILSQRVVENFSGSALDTDRWTFRNITGTGTGAMGNSVDGGYEINPSTGGTDQSQIDFNGIRQYSPTGCAMISVAKSIGVSPNHHVLGLINDYTLNISTAQTNSIIIDTSGASFRALSGDGSTWSSAGTVISKDNNWHNFKVEASSSNILYYADGLLRITKTTNRPTLPLQPRFVARYASSTLSIRYAEAYNT